MSGEAALRVRIVTADYYSAPPLADFDDTYNHFRGSVIKQLPIIRIFGITPTGEKACIHLHGVLPYIYIPYPKSIPKEKESSFLYEVAESMDEALNNSFGSKKHHIFSVSAVYAIPFYGYHSKIERFLKISFYHPSSIKRAISLLQSGAVCGQPFQPHEAHVPYILQFFIDYNLYGMNFLNLSQCSFRTSASTEDTPIHSLVKETTCAVEVDASASSILNIHSSSRVLNPGLAYIREEEERRNEEDGVLPEEGTPSDFRQFEPSPSDARFMEQLELALQERIAKETSAESARNLSESQSTSQHPAPVTFDHEDMSVLKVLFGRLVQDDLPDEDSVLGFTPEQDHHEDAEQDLSQPFVSFMIDSDEEDVTPKDIDLSETLVWPELDGLSQIEYKPDSPPLYVDGNMDADKTPEKVTRKTRSQNSPRYVPLDVKLHRSPRRKKSGIKVSQPTSPEIFKKLEEDVSDLRNIKSPRSKIEIKQRKKSTPSTSTDMRVYDNADIICSSDESDGETSERRLKFNFLENVSTNIVTKDECKKKKKTPTAKKVLFGNTTSYPIDSSDELSNLSNITVEENKTKFEETVFPVVPSTSYGTKNQNKTIEIEEAEKYKNKDYTEQHSESSVDVQTSTVTIIMSSEESKTSDDDRMSVPGDNTLHAVREVSEDRISEDSLKVKSTEEIIPTDQSDSENMFLDATNYSECTVMSFYGDTTMCLSPLEFNTIFTPLINPPTTAEIIDSLQTYGLERLPTNFPFYGDPMDASSSKEVGFNVISLKNKFQDDLEEFKGSFCFSSWPAARRSRRTVILEPVEDPPSSESIRLELEIVNYPSSIASTTFSSQQSSESQQSLNSSYISHNKKIQRLKVVELDRKKRQSGEIEQATPNNSGVFKLDFQNLQDAQINSLHKFTTLMVLELHANTRGDLRPDPEYDAIEAVFYIVANDAPESSSSQLQPRLTGVILVCPEAEMQQYPFTCSLLRVNSERELFSALIDLVTLHNPDIIAGYEIEMLSWGYLIERGYVLGINMVNELSRLKLDLTGKDLSSNVFTNKDYEMRISGRIVLNVWRLMRHEVALQSYKFENVAYHVLHTRIPKFSFRCLTSWWNHFSKCYKVLVMKYYLTMVDGIEKILDQLNLVGRTCELASLFGIQFYEVFSRGSQFRVESMMLRLAKRFNYIAVSPNVEQRAHMRAPESLPLIMEPESRMYCDPVIVLDFQSLYPSMIIAYNYCFSTCIGRVSSLMETSEFKFGCTELNVPLKELVKLQKNIHISPAGIAFVDKSIRHGVLPQMLDEILQTRLMVKASLKRHKKNKLLARVLDARQLGLKLIANVTYGYTSANFSGRMPCIEVGDSVVSKGRETLERAIQLVERDPEWRARVVYGDTDSLFVLCPGRSREEAFIIGQQIADRVTASNPSPVKLKLEKVYQPCILQTKKRYVGFMYESADQIKPTFDAKGIETVRRDGCPAASKILEKSIKLLFETGNVSIVKAYVIQQMVKVLSGRLSPAELAFAKEYRGVSGYQPNAPVPALKIAKELVRRDRRAEPRTSERVPYIVVCGPPGLPLISLVRSLEDFLSNPAYVINSDYYISKAILPPLDRCFCLIGADVFSWYSGLPKKQLFNLHQVAPSKRKATIAQYFRTVQCLSCGSLTPLTLCERCQQNPSHTLSLLLQTVNKLERKNYTFLKICQSCCGRSYETDCISLDCPVFYRRLQAANDMTQTNLLYTTIADLSEF